MADSHAHKHQLHEGDSLRQAARERLTGEGEQWTDMRAAVFDALAEFTQPASAYDIAESVSRAQGRRVAANSVYRILDLFVASNLARRECERLCRQRASRLPPRLHLPDLRRVRSDRAHRRRQAVGRGPRGRERCGILGAAAGY